MIFKYLGYLDQEYVAKQPVDGAQIFLVDDPNADHQAIITGRLVGGINATMPAVDADIYLPR